MLRYPLLVGLIIGTALLWGCDDSSEPQFDASTNFDDLGADVVQRTCESLSFRFSNQGSQEMEVFPDDRHTVTDADSPSGIRLHFDDERFPWLAELPALIKPTKVDFEQLSGFPHNGGILLRFDGPVPDRLPSPSESTVASGLLLLDLDSDPPTRIPFESRIALDESGVFLDPLATLKPGHRHVVLMTTHLWSSEVCNELNESFGALLNGDVEPISGDARFSNSLNEALQIVELDPESIVGGTAFTTHMDHLLLHEVAKEVRRRNYTWNADVSCEENEAFRICDAAFKAWDFRDPEMIRTTETSGQWSLPVRIYLPNTSETPLPVIIYGHGLNSDRFEGDRLATKFSRDGFAVVAVDALMHGDHPTRIEGSSLPALDFLGVDLPSAQVSGPILSGNFTQTVVDRLQLLQLLRRSPDFDGDGIADFNPQEIGYFGVSLGGMLGSLFLANANSIPAAVLSVAGGRLIQFLTDIPQIDAFRPALNNLAGGEAKAERILLFAQTMVDSADPATFAPFVLRQRLSTNSVPPHLLVPVADQDDTVPPATAHALARALGVPHVGPVFTDVFGLEKQSTPSSENTNYGVTAGYFQFDRCTNEGRSRVDIAEHAELPASEEALLQTRHFFTGWTRGEVPEIIDPYENLGTEPLPDQ